MADWNLYLARYQQTHGGFFFGGSDVECDSQLVLSEGEASPLLVCMSTDPAGRSTVEALRARTMVTLNRPYTLHIRARGLIGGGISGVAGLVGKAMDFGFSETKGRVITTDNRAFTKLTLGDLALRNALATRKKDALWIRPGPQGDGQHIVEVLAANFGGILNDESPWYNDAMLTDLMYVPDEDKEPILQAGSKYFDAQMDAFLDFLRAARDAVTQWPISP